MGRAFEDSELQQPAPQLTALPPRAIYALRAMAVLANQPPGASVSGRELAALTSIPSAFLSKVMRRLVAGGLVEARRGRGGGFRLARAPNRVSFARILEAVDVPLDGTRCAFGFHACDHTRPCALHGTWSRLREALSGWADGASLAETRVTAGNGALEP